MPVALPVKDLKACNQKQSRAVKKLFKLFERMSEDTKELDDIPNTIGR